MHHDLLNKYNVPAPRYTSYPTVPYWQTEAPSQNDWTKSVRFSFAENKEISLYIHLPYCESLCTYCGCNKRITKNHNVEQPYIESVLKEWKMYLNILPEKPIVREIHLGGGTPTFFSPEHLDYLLRNILQDAKVASEYSFSFEAHPASTTYEHLKTLADLGFRRLSIGVQDFDNEILKIINRHQSYEQVKAAVDNARALGYESINFDLIFGLPLQTPENIYDNFEKLKTLKPDRIAFYSYAHVPWVKPSQRAYSEKDLPLGADKRALYELGRQLLEKMGYHEIGMDHFALENDELYIAFKNKRLHRNFMGYTPFSTQLNLALGASSISDSWYAFIQNEKKIEDYQRRIEEGEFPIIKGHLLNKEDQIIRRHILNIMCQYETAWQEETEQCDALFAGLSRMKELESDELIERDPFCLKVTEKGSMFIRNICMAVDARYWKKRPEGAIFSQVV
ncbi:MAG: oxygen-independent coproporphyrinogen III oxidase [Bacteroidota bacterium]